MRVLNMSADVKTQKENLMKKFLFLSVIAMMILGTFVGCDTTTGPNNDPVGGEYQIPADYQNTTWNGTHIQGDRILELGVATYTIRTNTSSTSYFVGAVDEGTREGRPVWQISGSEDESNTFTSTFILYKDAQEILLGAWTWTKQ
jgi:hypothetical protein